MEQLKYPYNYRKADLIAYILLLDDIIVPTQVKDSVNRTVLPELRFSWKSSKGSADCHWEGDSFLKIAVKQNRVIKALCGDTAFS